MGKVIGIDFGTTNSVVAVMEGGQPVVIPNQEGNRITPSVVGFTKDGEILVGQIAKRQAITNPENTVFSIKRFMGRRFEEVPGEVKRVTYKVVKDTRGNAVVEIMGKTYTPTEISAYILMNMKKTAEDYLGEKVTMAVITVPDYFNDSQRQAIKDAGQIAGLEVRRIVNEATVSSLAYGLDKKKDEIIAVYDFGGGTFDISILNLGKGVFKVESTNGDTHLGGDDIDQSVIDWLAEKFIKQYGIDLRKDKMALLRLKEAAEKAKCELSTSMQTNINLPFIMADASGFKHMDIALTRAQLECLMMPFVERSIEPCRKALADAKYEPSDIDEVILVGGSIRIPLVQQKVQDLFGKVPYKGVNPDEAVAVGAAIQASVLAGELIDVLLLDVTPLSLGIETLGWVRTVLIPRNTTIPTMKSEIFSTASDNQTAVQIHVLQGEREMAADNRTLGRFDLIGIPPQSRGVPKIEVTFDIDANGILHVSAKDLGTGMNQKIRIESSSGLSKEEIERMVKTAEEHLECDRRKLEEITLRNQADTVIYSLEKMLNEMGNKIPQAEKKEVEEGIVNLKKILENGKIEEIKIALDHLNSASNNLSEVLYRQTSGHTKGDSSSSTGRAGP